MAMAQHYGHPSHGLDVTRDLDIALWFATNRFGQRDRYAEDNPLMLESWPVEPSAWPVIFAIQGDSESVAGSLQQCYDLEEFGIPAARPLRQRASFFLGGHSDHQNRLAENLSCAF